MGSTADTELFERLERAEREHDRYDAALSAVVRHFRADSGTLHLRSGELLRLTAHTPGIPPAVLEIIRSVPVGKGMAGLAAERKAPVTACNLQTDTTGDVRPGARGTGLKGSIVVPLLSDDEVRGTLGIGNRDEREFRQDEIALLVEAGRRIAAWAQVAD